jgi:phage-related protein
VKLSVAVNQLVSNGTQLEAFLVSLRGTRPFAFDTDAPPELQGLNFKCKEYQVNYAGQQNGILHHQFQGTFEQVWRVGL